MQGVDTEDVRRHVIEVRALLAEEVGPERRAEPLGERVGLHAAILIDSDPMVQIHGVPAFEDDYLWVIEDGRHAAVVDPGDAWPGGGVLERRCL